MVTVAFDPTLIPEPKPEPEADAARRIPDDPFQPTPTIPSGSPRRRPPRRRPRSEKADHEKKIADGKKQVKELTDRFAAWYYVTPGDSFRSIALDRAALVRDKSEASPPAPPACRADVPGGVPGRLPRACAGRPFNPHRG